jgi:hypothetical protein
MVKEKMVKRFFVIAMLAFPALIKSAYVQKNKIVMEYLYQGITFMVNLSETERVRIEGRYPKSSVYGEMAYDSWQEIVDREFFGPNDVFYNFGSGAGRMVVQAFLNTAIKKAVGIEASASRYESVIRMMQRFKKTDAYTDRQYNAIERRVIDFINKNFLKANVDDATIVYVGSLCFTTEFMQKLVEKFKRINRIGLRVITESELPDGEQNGFRFDRSYQVLMSGSKNGGKVTVYVYTYVGTLLQ